MVSDFKAEKRKRDISKKYCLDHIDEILMGQLVQFPGTGLRELGALCGMSASGVRKRTLAPAFRKALADASGVSSGRLAALSAIALSRLEKLVKSNDDRIALSAIGLILDAVAKLKDHVATGPTTIIYKTNMSEDGRLFQEIVQGFESELLGDSSTPATVNS